MATDTAKFIKQKKIVKYVLEKNRTVLAALAEHDKKESEKNGK